MMRHSQVGSRDIHRKIALGESDLGGKENGDFWRGVLNVMRKREYESTDKFRLG
jgi:hypothetical protein